MRPLLKLSIVLLALFLAGCGSERPSTPLGLLQGDRMASYRPQGFAVTRKSAQGSDVDEKKEKLQAAKVVRMFTGPAGQVRSELPRAIRVAQDAGWRPGGPDSWYKTTADGRQITMFLGVREIGQGRSRLYIKLYGQHSAVRVKH